MNIINIRQFLLFFKLNKISSYLQLVSETLKFRDILAASDSEVKKNFKNECQGKSYKNILVIIFSLQQKVDIEMFSLIYNVYLTLNKSDSCINSTLIYSIPYVGTLLI